MKFTVILEPKNHGSFKARVPSLPICTDLGVNENEALKKVRSTILLHLRIEEISHPQKQNNLAYFKYRLKEAITGKMSIEKKQATLTALTGICMMIVVLWGAGFFA